MFFEALKYLDGKPDDFKSFLADFLENKLVNVFSIENQDILKTIKINFRIHFLKEILFPDLLSQDQTNDLGDYLLLHGNNIIMYLIDDMQVCFSKLREKIQETPYKVSCFFFELSRVLRIYSFPVLKTEFSNNFVSLKLHEPLLNLILELVEKKDLSKK